MEKLINSYVEWIKEGLTLQKVNSDWYELVTPFLNHKNDMIELYLKQTPEKIIITDGGNTLNELRLSGVDLTRSKKRAEELNSILRSFGISRNEKDEIFVTTDEKKFPEVKHRLIQAVLSIDDMFMLSTPKVESFFVEDIAGFFELNDVIYVKDATFTGKSGYSHKFDFTLPKIKQRPELAVKAINNPRKDQINSVMWAFEDTKQSRPETKGLVIINDANEVSSEVQQALEEYNISYFPWSKRFEYLYRIRA